MARNLELATFLREKRGKRTCTAVCEAIGAWSYWRWEKEGYLPKKAETLSKLASVLGTSVEELQSFIPDPVVEDVTPLLMLIVAASTRPVSREDLLFLLDTEKKLNVPMTTDLVQALLKARSQIKVPPD